MSTQAIQAGEAFVQLNVNSDPIQKSLTKIGSQIDDFGSKTVKSLSLIRGALGGAVDDCSQFGKAISLVGQGVNYVSGLVGSFSQFSSYLKATTTSANILTFSQLQQTAALKLNTVITSENCIARSALTAISYLHAASLKALCGVQWLLNGAMLACPITWIIGGLTAVVGVIGGAMFFLVLLTTSWLIMPKRWMKFVREMNPI